MIIIYYYISVLQINKIYNMDCLEGIAQIHDSSIQITCSSPPYQKVRDYHGYSFNFEKTADELYRITSDGGVVCWIIGDSVEKGSETLEPFRQALYFKSIGFFIHDTMIYQKRNFSHPEKNRYHSVFEYVFIITKGKLKTFNPIMDRKNITAGAVGNLGINSFTEKDGSKSIRKKQITKEFGKRHNIWLGNTAGQENMCKELKHPAIAPRWLCSDLIKSFSNEGDICFDPCSGSGTSLIEASKLKRHFIGIEISKEYCLLSQEKFKEEMGVDVEIV